MKETKFSSITGKTSLVGVIGDPISHSLSPVIQNAALHKMNLDWCYLAIPCKPDNLESIIKCLSKINCKGLNITIPHKTNALKFCNHVSEIATKVGAINTLIPDNDDGWIGTNTDVEGFLKPLGLEKNWESRNAVILGNGGSARAVLLGLEKLKLAEIAIIGRKETSITNLINSLTSPNGNIKGLTQDSLQLNEYIKNADLIINTTPIGMLQTNNTSYIDSEIPFGEKIWDNLKPKTTLYDLIYNPRPTKWLEIGKEKGCIPIDGLEMLIQQGAASLRLWSGIEEIPIDIMRKSAKDHLLN